MLDIERKLKKLGNECIVKAKFKKKSNKKHGNKRIGSQHLMLEDITAIVEGQEIFLRCHTWVNNSNLWIEQDLKGEEVVLFTSRIEEYKDSKNINKLGLRHIRNIQRI